MLCKIPEPHQLPKVPGPLRSPPQLHPATAVTNSPQSQAVLAPVPIETVYQASDLSQLFCHLLLRSKDMVTQDNVCLGGSWDANQALEMLPALNGSLFSSLSFHLK